MVSTGKKHSDASGGPPDDGQNKDPQGDHAVRLRPSLISPLHGLYVITDERATGSHEVMARAAIEGGARIIQLRGKHTSPAQLLATAHILRHYTHEADVLFIINDNPELALAVKADGVHLGPDDLTPREARQMLGPGYLIGVSRSDAAEAKLAARDGADYIGAGAVFGTQTKLDAGAPIGLEALRSIVEATPLSVAAIGGVGLSNIHSVREAGAEMACVISEISGAGDEKAMAAVTPLAGRIFQSLIMNLHQLGEFGLIEHLRSRLKTKSGVLESIGDDAAILASLHTPVVTCDALIENAHFRRDWTTPFLLGRKAMSVNVSDIAASGATPVAAFVCLGISISLAGEEGALEWLDCLYDGFQSAADEYGFTLAGGDTVRTSREMMISITMIGEVEEKSRQAGAPLLRSGARVGDDIFVTGTLGDSAAGLFLLEHPEIEVTPETRTYLLNRHFNPTPRLREVNAALQENTIITAALDLSDGLAGDAAHIAHRSQVQLQIETANLPISPECLEAAIAARQAGFPVSAQQWALSGGEDYELLLCIAPESSASVAQTIQNDVGTPTTKIGACRPLATPGVLLIDAHGETGISSKAWTHF